MDNSCDCDDSGLKEHRFALIGEAARRSPVDSVLVRGDLIGTALLPWATWWHGGQARHDHPDACIHLNNIGFPFVPEPCRHRLGLAGGARRTCSTSRRRRALRPMTHDTRHAT